MVSPGRGRRSWARWVVAITVAVVAVAVGALWLRALTRPSPPDLAHPTTSIVPVAGHPVVSHPVTCTSAAGDLGTTVEFQLIDHSEPVSTGARMRVDLAMPFIQVTAPVEVRFVSGTTHLPAPDGFRFTEASMVPSSNPDFTSTSVSIDSDGRGLTYDLAGSFPMNGTTRNLPVLSITGEVEASTGETLRFPPPDHVTAQTDAGIFGEQDSSCRVLGPEPIAEIAVTD